MPIGKENMAQAQAQAQAQAPSSRADGAGADQRWTLRRLDRLNSDVSRASRSCSPALRESE